MWEKARGSSDMEKNQFGAAAAILLTCALRKHLLESQTATPVLQGKDILLQTWLTQFVRPLFLDHF